MKRLQEIKKQTVRAVLPNSDQMMETFYGTVSAFPMSYSIGRSIIEFCRERQIDPSRSRILIVGAHGGRDYYWLTGYRYQVDVLDLGHHSWGQSHFVGDASKEDTWDQIEDKYDLIIMHDILEHLPEDFAALRYARRALKKAGFLFLSVPFRHDPEITHIRSYSEITLGRLLSVAGYKTVWKRARPGLLEAFPRFVNLVNYGLALAMPSTRLGARFLEAMLKVEYRINDRTRGFYRVVGRSPQKGITVAAQSSPDESLKTHLETNKALFTLAS